MSPYISATLKRPPAAAEAAYYVWQKQTALKAASCFTLCDSALRETTTRQGQVTAFAHAVHVTAVAFGEPGGDWVGWRGAVPCAAMQDTGRLTTGRNMRQAWRLYILAGGGGSVNSFCFCFATYVFL